MLQKIKNMKLSSNELWDSSNKRSIPAVSEEKKFLKILGLESIETNLFETADYLGLVIKFNMNTFSYNKITFRTRSCLLIMSRFSI